MIRLRWFAENMARFATAPDPLQIVEGVLFSGIKTKSIFIRLISLDYMKFYGMESKIHI